MTAELLVVDGVDGSGKSTLARTLVEHVGQAGVSVVHLAVDDFRRPVAWDSVAPDDEASVYYERYYDLEALGSAVHASKRGGTLQVPLYDSRRERLEGMQEFNFQGVALVVVEGVMVRRVRQLDGAPGLYLSVPLDVAAARLMERDTQKGRSPEEVRRRMERRYFPAHQRYVREHRPEEAAAVRVDHTDWRKPRLLAAEWGQFHPAARTFLSAWTGITG